VASLESEERLRTSEKRIKWSRKRGHKLHGIGVGRIRTFDAVSYDSVKTISSEFEAKAEEPAKYNRSSEVLRVRSDTKKTVCDVCSDSDNLVSHGFIREIGILLPTPSVWFPLEDLIALRLWLTRPQLRFHSEWKQACTKTRNTGTPRNTPEHLGTKEYRKTLEHRNTPEHCNSRKNPEHRFWRCCFCCPITDHVKNKLSMYLFTTHSCCRSEWTWSELARQLSNQQKITL